MALSLPQQGQMWIVKWVWYGITLGYLKWPRRWPLMIDPQRQAGTRWVTWTESAKPFQWSGSYLFRKSIWKLQSIQPVWLDFPTVVIGPAEGQQIHQALWQDGQWARNGWIPQIFSWKSWMLHGNLLDPWGTCKLSDPNLLQTVELGPQNEFVLLLLT